MSLFFSLFVFACVCFCVCCFSFNSTYDGACATGLLRLQLLHTVIESTISTVAWCYLSVIDMVACFIWTGVAVLLLRSRYRCCSAVLPASRTLGACVRLCRMPCARRHVKRYLRVIYYFIAWNGCCAANLDAWSCFAVSIL